MGDQLTETSRSHSSYKGEVKMFKYLQFFLFSYLLVTVNCAPYEATSTTEAPTSTTSEAPTSTTTKAPTSTTTIAPTSTTTKAPTSTTTKAPSTTTPKAPTSTTTI